MELKEIRHLITYDCILRCLHCYMSAGEHEGVEAMQFSQEEADNFYGFFKPKVVSATGGEPLRELELVRKLARSTAKYGGSLELVTNGLLLTEEIVKELNDLNEKTFYQISLDGTKEYHDFLRNRKGAYEGAKRAIGLASNSGRLTKVRMTVTEGNFGQVPEIINELDGYQKGNISLVMRPVIYSGRAKKNELMFGKKSYKDLDEFAKKAKFVKVETTDNLSKCGCGMDTIAIDPRGDIYPCCYMVFNPNYKMGNMIDNFKSLNEHSEFAKFGGICYARSLKK